MEYRNIILEIRQRVGIVQLNRPKALNALNRELMQEIATALDALEDDPEIGAIVITGDQRAFAAGADIKDMASATSVEMLINDTIGLWDRIAQTKKPIIAAVSGWVLGGGNELAMACDMIVAGESAKFGQPEINIGVIPGAGGTQRLTRAVGKAVAMEMVLNDRHLTAAEALHYGLVNKVVPDESFLEEAIRLAEEIAVRAPLAIRFGKEVVNQAFETSLSEGIAYERRTFYFLFGTDDQMEGMQAFVEKRKPTWRGR